MSKDSHVVSVIIPTLGRDTLTQCQTALGQQTRPPDEVVVVVDRERRGLSWGRNEGIRRAHGDLLAFIDDDCVPPSNWLEQLIRAIDAYEAAGAGGTFQESDPLLADIRQRHPLPSTMQLDMTGLVGNGGNIMYKREWLERCATRAGQVFDETTFKSLAEDWEFVQRLHEQGARLVYVPNHVLHLRRATVWGHLRQQFYRGKGIALLFKLHRASSSNLIAHDSLLWGKAGVKHNPAWLTAIWHKLIGPFDAHHFSSWRNFWLFWLGEKFQSLGFLWGLLRLRYEKPAPSVE